MSLPKIVSQDEWTAARRACSRRRRSSPGSATRSTPSGASCRWSRSTKDYEFDGPDGTVSLLDLFEGRPQLIVYHFMFHPDWDDGCPSCTAGIDEVAPGFLEHLHTRDTTYAMVSRAPLREARAVEGEEGLVRCRGTRPTTATSATTSAPRSTRRGASTSSTTARSTSTPRMGQESHEDVRAALRHAGPELLPRRSTAACSTRTRCTPAASRAPAARTTSSTTPPSAARRTGRSPSGRSASVRGNQPDFAS